MDMVFTNDIDRQLEGVSTSMQTYSGWGPTDDGRMKPDVVANGFRLYSSDNSADNGYDDGSGTSAASAHAAGSAILLQEYFSEQLPGSAMRASTLNALLIVTADALGFTRGPNRRGSR